MAALRCFFAIKINIHVVQCILCGQYILADRFLMNGGYLVELEILMTFVCQFPSKESLEKSKNTELLVLFDFKMAVLSCFFSIKINQVHCIFCGQYILVDRCLENRVDLVEHVIFSTFGCQFPFKEVLRNLKIPKNPYI